MTSDVDHLAHHVRIHLVGAAAGIELFSRGESFSDPTARETIARIRAELFEERKVLVGIVEGLGSSDPKVTSTGAKLGEKLGRLKPNGHPVKRTPLTDVVDLEAMRVALAGKISGWDAMLQSSRIDHEVVSGLLDQARRQHDQISELHTEAAKRAFSSDSSASS